jgi:YD repeat-containing protein
VTKVSYPDGTFERYGYDRLDLVAYRDRQDRGWAYAYDANRRLVSVVDPMGQETLFGYDPDGRLASLTDPKENVTAWAYDVQGRLVLKTWPDDSTTAYTYETATSRLKSVEDALGQTKQFTYALDDRLAGIAYLDAVNPTPDVAFAYDPYLPRLASMTDGAGTTAYGYVPVGELGALQLAQESGPLADSAIAYAYDELGRLASRTVQGAGAESFAYDALGRLTGHTSDLGQFTLQYLGETGQLVSRALAASSLATAWSYLPNAGDRRLAGIANTGLSGGHTSDFAFTTSPENFIEAIVETSDAATVYPTTSTQTAAYNELNQLTDLSGQALTWDANGNLLSDGQRTYSWDAENRLVAIAYPGEAGKLTAFAYDGLGRRVEISRTPAGDGAAVETSYLWCGLELCQARDGNNDPARSYYAEGEVVPGSPATLYYYGTDQLGSGRRRRTGTEEAKKLNEINIRVRVCASPFSKRSTK